VAITTMPRPAGAGDLLRRRCEDLLAAEMERLARRVPALPPECLGDVESGLRRIIDRLVLSRARAVRGDQLAVLFGLADAR
jgi:hypothetical protein